MSKEIDLETVASLKELDGENGKDFYTELVELYAEQFLKHYTTLQSFAETKDLKKISSILHQLKSSSGNLGALDFAKYCGELEEDAAEGSGVRAIAEMPKLLQRYELVKKELESQKN